MARDELLNAEQGAVVRAVVRAVRDRCRSQKQVAPQTGISQQSVSRILDPRKPVGLRAATALANKGLIDLAALLEGRLADAIIEGKPKTRTMQRRETPPDWHQRYSIAKRVEHRLVHEGKPQPVVERVVALAAFTGDHPDERRLYDFVLALVNSETAPPPKRRRRKG